MNRSAVLVFLALLIIVRSASPASARLVLASPRIAEVAGSPPAGHDTVTIMPFENLSGRPEYNWIGEAFAVELAALLDTPELSAIQPDERDVAFKEGGLPPAAILTHATMFKIAERAGANLVVIGSYRITGEGRASNITFTARTVNINEGMLMGREQNAGGPLLEFERMLGELAYEILYQHNSTIPYSRDEIVSEATSVPIGAFENYVKGKLTREHDAKVEFLERAVKEYAQKANGGKYAAAIFELGRIHYFDHDYKEAIEDLDAIGETDPRFNESQFYIAVAQDADSEMAEALARLIKLKARMPLFEVYNNIGVIYLSQKQYASAIEHLEPASAAATRDTDTLFNLGYAYYLAGDYKNAADTLRGELERRPSDPEATYVLSKALAAVGDTVAAGKASDEAKKLLPDFAQWETHGMPFLARIKSDFSKANYYRYERDQKAKLSLDTRAAGDTPPANDALQSAMDAFAAGRDEEALATLGKLLQSEPQSYQAHLLMGRIYERRGDTGKAANSLKAALFWNPKLTEAQVLLGRIALLKNDCQSAEMWAGRALQTDPGSQDAQALKRLMEQKCNASRTQ